MNITRAADASIHAVSPALSFGTGHLQGKKPQRWEQANLNPAPGPVKDVVPLGDHLDGDEVARRRHRQPKPQGDQHLDASG